MEVELTYIANQVVHRQIHVHVLHKVEMNLYAERVMAPRLWRLTFKVLEHQDFFIKIVDNVYLIWKNILVTRAFFFYILKIFFSI